MLIEIDGIIPWSFDYRGRAYPIPSFLSIHDTDFGKSLIRFADEADITTEGIDWLKFQLATTYGLDKKPMQERLDWVDNNHHLITLIALILLVSCLNGKLLMNHGSS